MIRHAKNGFTLIEIIIVLAVAAAMALIAVPSWQQWQSNQRARTASESIAKAFKLARGEAIRTGRNHIVFFQEDTNG